MGSRVFEDNYHAGPDGSPLQAGALPLRWVDGAYEIFLITSVANAWWGIPKGWPRRGEKLRDTAIREAAEEAGIHGIVAAKPHAVFRYEKQAVDGKPGNRDIAAFIMRVDEVLASWPEQHRRRRGWFRLEEAATMVKSPTLAEIMRRLQSEGESAAAGAASTSPGRIAA